MKVLNICVDDWANFMHNITLAMRTTGIQVDELKWNRHVNKYPTETPIATPEQSFEMIIGGNYDVIQIFHSSIRFNAALAKTKAKKIVWHTGSYYRENHEQLNGIFNRIVSRSVLALPEFWDKGAKEQTYCVGCVPDPCHDIPIEKWEPSQKLMVVGHYPSNPIVKGTAEILDSMDVLMKTAPDIHGKWVFSYETGMDKKTMESNMSMCDIYIELFKPELNGHKYGSFGMTAIEAAATGCIVMTQSLSNKVYEKHYGQNPFMLLNAKQDIAQSLAYLIRSSPELINAKKNQHRLWYLKNHAFEPTGIYILNNILNGI